MTAAPSYVNSLVAGMGSNDWTWDLKSSVTNVAMMVTSATTTTVSKAVSQPAAVTASSNWALKRATWAMRATTITPPARQTVSLLDAETGVAKAVLLGVVMAEAVVVLVGVPASHLVTPGVPASHLVTPGVAIVVLPITQLDPVGIAIVGVVLLVTKPVAIRAR